MSPLTHPAEVNALIVEHLTANRKAAGFRLPGGVPIQCASLGRA
jgi:hypothetical protein